MPPMHAWRDNSSKIRASGPRRAAKGVRGRTIILLSAVLTGALAGGQATAALAAGTTDATAKARPGTAMEIAQIIPGTQNRPNTQGRQNTLGKQNALAPSSSRIDKYRDQRRAKQQLLLRKRQREAAVRADMATINKDRERFSARLVETARAIQNSERQMSAIEARQKKLAGRESILRAALARRHDVIAKLLAAMQRMGRNPPPVMITRRKDALKVVRSAMLLAATFPELREKALDLASRLSKLQQVVDESAAEAKKLKVETKRLKDTQTRLATLMEEKRRSLGQRQTELAALHNEVREIKKSVSGLGDLIAKLDRAVAARTRLGLYNKKQSKTLASGRPLPSTGTGTGTGTGIGTGGTGTVHAARRPQVNNKIASLMVPVRPPIGRHPAPGPSKSSRSSGMTRTPGRPSAPDAVVIAPTTNISLISPGRLQPAFPFSKAKGRLPRPAQGRQLVSYGEKTQYGARSKGIVIATRYAAQITSPTDGWVVFAGEFRSYGQLLIINAGQKYHILLAGMSRIDVQPGQFVLAGEPVGTMSGASRRLRTISKKSAPVLYVEFRKNGRPINPKPWWAKELQKVQG